MFAVMNRHGGVVRESNRELGRGKKKRKTGQKLSIL
jgi:hypothetical protein